MLNRKVMKNLIVVLDLAESHCTLVDFRRRLKLIITKRIQ